MTALAWRLCGHSHEGYREEGGPVEESMVGMAAVQRAIRRKKAEAGEGHCWVRLAAF